MGAKPPKTHPARRMLKENAMVVRWTGRQHRAKH